MRLAADHNMDELVPPDYLISPEQFQTVFMNREGYQNLRQLALDGHLGSVHNRFTAWKLLLGLLPESGSAEEWVAASTELRRAYKSLQDRLRVRKYLASGVWRPGPIAVQSFVHRLRRKA